jgi:hypothetical protein
MSTHNIEISWFQKFAEANPFIKRFSFGDPSGIDLGKEGEYPIMHVQYNGTTYGEKSVSSAYAITLLDLPIDIDNKVINQREVISDMRQVAEDILAAIQNGDGSIFPSKVSFENPNITIFTEDYTNVLSGVQLDLNLTYPFLYNFCISPLGTGTEEPNIPSTEYSTGRIRISQEEVELGYARELNFDDTFEVSLVGNIAYITALGGGGGGGGSTWFDGAGVPSSGTGSNGDYYLNTTNGDVYRKSSGTWSVVGNIKGPQGDDGADGPAIELQVNATHIQWRVVGDSTWIDLIALSTITGSDGREVELRVSSNILQWRYVGDASWTNLIDLTTLIPTQVQSDWNQTDNTQVDFIKNKPTIPSAAGFVPYTGATADLDMGTHNVTADHITLNVSPSGAGYVVGATQWNNTLGSSQTLLKGGTVSLKNGVDLVARIVNKVTPNTTLTKAAYQVVRVSGATGGRLSVNLAQANNDANSADTIGVVTETIATNQEGFIITVGQLENINTTGSLQGETWADGDVLYLSPTTPGSITKVKPTGNGHIVVIGYVEYAHVNNGSIYVKVMNGWELDELHDVNITSVANNQVLRYNSTSQLWVNDSIPTVLGYTPVTQARTITIDGTTLDLSANRTFSTTGSRQSALLATPGANVAINTTTFSGLSSASNSTEGNRQNIFGLPVTFTGFGIITNNPQPASGNLIITLRVAGADTALSYTIVGGSGAGPFTASASVAAGATDRIAIKLQNTSTTNTSATIITITTTFTI